MIRRLPPAGFEGTSRHGGRVDVNNSPACADGNPLLVLAKNCWLALARNRRLALARNQRLALARNRRLALARPRACACTNPAGLCWRESADLRGRVLQATVVHRFVVTRL